MVAPGAGARQDSVVIPYDMRRMTPRTARYTRWASICLIVACALPADAQAPPRAPTTCKNCWPSECGPGKWTARGEVLVHRSPTDSSPLGFVIHARDTFDVDSSLVQVTQFGIVVVRVPHERYAPGDTVLITSFVGEGNYTTWRRGRSGIEPEFWDNSNSAGAPGGELLRSLKQRWWIHVRRATHTGWTAVSDSTPLHPRDCP